MVLRYLLATTWRRILLRSQLVLLVSSLSAQGEVRLSSYSSAHPLKIMAIGDSITDDCVHNGAWRQYLQLLLETNGYPFTSGVSPASSNCRPPAILDLNF